MDSDMTFDIVDFQALSCFLDTIMPENLTLFHK